MRTLNFLCRKWHRKDYWVYLAADQGELVYHCKKCEVIRYVKDDRKGFWDVQNKSKN